MDPMSATSAANISNPRGSCKTAHFLIEKLRIEATRIAKWNYGQVKMARRGTGHCQVTK